MPLSLSADLASVGSSSGLSYHLLLQQNSGEPKCFGGDGTSDVPIALLPGLCAKAAVSIKKSIDVWRRKEDKLKNVQPYDVFLSDSHVSFTGIVGKHPAFRLVLITVSLAVRVTSELEQFTAQILFKEILCAYFCLTVPVLPLKLLGNIFISMML